MCVLFSSEPVFILTLEANKILVICSAKNNVAFCIWSSELYNKKGEELFANL